MVELFSEKLYSFTLFGYPFPADICLKTLEKCKCIVLLENKINKICNFLFSVQILIDNNRTTRIRSSLRVIDREIVLIGLKVNNQCNKVNVQNSF